MPEQWMTYTELGERIGVSPQAARQRAGRLRLRRQIGNDGKARVAVDLDEITLNPPRAPVDHPSDTSTDTRPTGVDHVSNTRPDTELDHPVDDRLYEALREQIAFLKEQLAKVEALAEAHRANFECERGKAAEMAADLRGLNEQVAEVERVKTELIDSYARERDRADRLVSEVADLARQLAKVMEESRAKETELQARAIDAETALAAFRARPWWRRVLR